MDNDNSPINELPDDRIFDELPDDRTFDELPETGTSTQAPIGDFGADHPPVRLSRRPSKSTVALILALLLLGSVIAVTVILVTYSPSQSPSSSLSSQSVEEYAFTVGNRSVTVYAGLLGPRVSISLSVTNVGSKNLYLPSGQFDIVYPDGTIADVVQYVHAYPDVLRRGETTYYYADQSYGGEDVDGLLLVDHLEIKGAKISCVRLECSEIEFRTGTVYDSVIGRVKNNTAKELSTVSVYFNFFDKNGVFLGHDSVYVNVHIPAGEKVGFELLLDSQIPFDLIDKYEVFAYPLQIQL